jgi:hypothetical protein
VKLFGMNFVYQYSSCRFWEVVLAFCVESAIDPLKKRDPLPVALFLFSLEYISPDV